MSARALRILLVSLNYSPETTGVAPYAASLASGLQERGFDVHVITARPHYPQWRVFEGEEFLGTRVETKIRVTRVPHFVPSRPTFISRLVSELSFGVAASFQRWGRPDIVLMTSPALFASLVCLVRARLSLRRCPVALWAQDLYGLGIRETSSESRSLGALVGRVESWAYRHADGVFPIHDRFARSLVSRLGVNAERVRVVRNWTHIKRTKAFDREAVRASLGWSSREFVVLHAGNMGVKQGLDNVLHAAQLIAARGLSIRFVLMGDGSQRKHLEAVGVDLPTLEFKDGVDSEVFMEVLGSADALLVNELPGVAEMAVPSKLTSYFSTGLPVVAATALAGVTAQEIGRSEAGIVVKAGDPKALIEACTFLQSNPEVAKAMGERGKAFQSLHLDETSAIDRYAHHLTRLARGLQDNT